MFVQFNLSSVFNPTTLSKYSDNAVGLRLIEGLFLSCVDTITLFLPTTKRPFPQGQITAENPLQTR